MPDEADISGVRLGGVFGGRAQPFPVVIAGGCGFVRAEIAELHAEMYNGFRRQTAWVLSAITAYAAITVAVVGLVR